MGMRVISRRVCGVEVVRAVVDYTVPQDVRLEHLADEALSWVDAALFPYAKACYEADPSPQKRFFFPRFTYILRICAQERDRDVLFVHISATLTGTRNAILAQTEQRLMLRSFDGAILPPKKRRRRAPLVISAENQ